MGKLVKKVIAILLAATAVILLVLPADGVSATYTKGDFVIDGGTLVSYTGSESDITIPLGITSIGKDAFSGNNNLVSVYIPDEVTSIDYAAFENCKNLRKVSMGSGVKSIGSSAFSGCQSLSDVNIPRYVDNLGSGVFAACPNLSTVNIDSNNRNLICLDGVIYSRDGKKMYQYLAGRPYSTYEIPQPVKEIGEFGFYGANMLTTVTVADGIEEIPEYAFLNCTALNKVNLPNSIKAIRKGAFGGCTNLKALTVPTTCGTIDPEAFTSLTGETGDVINDTTGEVLSESNEGSNGVNSNSSSANIDEQNNTPENDSNPDSNSDTNTDVNSDTNENTNTNQNTDASNNSNTDADEIGKTTIVGGEAIFLIDPKSMHVKGFDLNEAQTEDSIAGSSNTSAVGEDIRNYSGKEFDIVSGTLGHYGGASESVIIPSGIDKIGNRVFYNNKTIKSVDIPIGVTEIGDFAFARSGLESVSIPDGTTKIGYAAFYNCANLNTITVPSSVETIELGALEGSGFLNNWYTIEDGNNFLVLGDGILVAYKGIKSDVVIPNSVKQIGAGVFEGNEKIKSVTIPDSVIKIGEDAFNGCINLSSLALPANLKTIEDRAFKDTNINSVEIPASVDEIGLGAFDTKNVNGGLDAVVFKGSNLPDITYKPTASRLSASDLRTNAFNGCKYAFVGSGTDINSGNVFEPYTYGFRGLVYSSGAELAEGDNLLQLRKCIAEPDINGAVDIDSTVSIGGSTYTLSGVSDVAFDAYNNPDWCENKLTSISLNGNNSEELNKLLSDVNYSANTGSNTGANERDAITVLGNGISNGNGQITASIPSSSEKFNLYVNKNDSLVSDFNNAFDNRYGNHNGVQMDTFSVDMTDRLGSVPIHKMAKSKLEISMPLPDKYNESENVKMYTIDDNGLLEEVHCDVSDNGESNKTITFVASHLSPFAIVVLSDSEGLTVTTESVSIMDEGGLGQNLSAGQSENIVIGTLSKRVAGIPARFLIAIIMFGCSALLLITKKTVKRSKK